MSVARRTFARLLAALLCVCAGTASARDERDVGLRSALALELRLLAPCCWNQTLDVHESELASALRAEIAARIADGEPSQAIEADLVARYGERIRAVPAGLDTRNAIPMTVGVSMLAVMSVLIALGLRWRRRGLLQQPSLPEQDDDEVYAERVEEELRQL